MDEQATPAESAALAGPLAIISVDDTSIRRIKEHDGNFWTLEPYKKKFGEPNKKLVSEVMHRGVWVTGVIRDQELDDYPLPRGVFELMNETTASVTKNTELDRSDEHVWFARPYHLSIDSLNIQFILFRGNINTYSINELTKAK